MWILALFVQKSKSLISDPLLIYSQSFMPSSRIRILQILKIVKKSRILTNFKTADKFYYFILFTF